MRSIIVLLVILSIVLLFVPSKDGSMRKPREMFVEGLSCPELDNKICTQNKGLCDWDKNNNKCKYSHTCSGLNRLDCKKSIFCKWDKSSCNNNDNNIYK